MQILAFVLNLRFYQRSPNQILEHQPYICDIRTSAIMGQDMYNLLMA